MSFNKFLKHKKYKFHFIPYEGIYIYMCVCGYFGKNRANFIFCSNLIFLNLIHWKLLNGYAKQKYEQQRLRITFQSRH